ncbi:ComEA family DNA-binding protein [Chitinophaga sp. 22620]|uniref:ComEA family DNA-binding protein n=1 Tax=Chitinophaga sp. 22620 TaxID=3453952 RepID=UPI003F85D788
MADTSGLHAVAGEIAALMEAEREAASQQYRSRWRDSGRWKNERRYGGKYDDGKHHWRNFYRDSGRQGWRNFHHDSGRHAYYGSRSPFSGRRMPVPVIDINAADSAQWERLPGIGPTLAKRIVGFRERLGGFYDTRQVGEVYGLADSVFNKIQPFLRLGDVSLRKISLNDTDDKSLALHPYINTKLARVIVRYRSAHGPFREVEALRALALVDDSIYRKIEKYLAIN